MDEEKGLDFADAVPGCSKNMDLFRWPAKKPHPLLIPDVARDILMALNKIGDVENCRKVSRVWNDEACSVLQKKKLIALLEIDAVKFYLKKMEATPYFPHASFELHTDLTGCAVMDSFWGAFGSHIKSLDLHQPTLYSETLVEVIARHLRNLERLAIKALPKRLVTRRSSCTATSKTASAPPQPVEDYSAAKFLNLKEFIVYACHHEEINQNVTLVMLKDLIRRMPNLVKISIADLSPMMLMEEPASVNRTRLSKFLTQILIDPLIPLNKLSKIDFPLDIGNPELTSLTEKKFKFRKVVLKLQLGTRPIALRDFLTSLGFNVRNVDIEFPPGFFTCAVTFPLYNQMKPAEVDVHLQQVTDLTLKNFQGSLRFVQNLANLKRLTVNEASIDPYHPLNFEHRLETLRTDSSLMLGAILSMYTSFPLLRTVQISGLDDDGLGIIYRNLPYLLELEIHNGTCTDQGISGVPLEVCVDMTETATFHFVDPAKFRRDLFLGSLQYLKVLKLSSENITDIAIVFGIVDCKNLERLTIQSSAIADTGLIKIGDRMRGQLTYLDVHDCGNVSEEGKFYVKEKMKSTTLVLELPFTTKFKRPDNPYRQVGFPFRTRLNRTDPRYAGLPLEDQYALGDHRMFMGIERRRHPAQFRMFQHHYGLVHQQAGQNLVEDDFAMMNGLLNQHLGQPQAFNDADDDGSTDEDEIERALGDGDGGGERAGAGGLVPFDFSAAPQNEMELPLGEGAGVEPMIPEELMFPNLMMLGVADFDFGPMAMNNEDDNDAGAM